MSFRGNLVKNANIYSHEIVNLRKFAKIYRRENIYIHSIIPTWIPINGPMQSIYQINYKSDGIRPRRVPLVLVVVDY